LRQGKLRQSAGVENRRDLAIIGLNGADHLLPSDHHASPISELVQDILRTWPTDRLTFGELIEALGQRGYGALIVLLALPNLLPFWVPFLSPLVGVPMFIICAQLAFGRTTPRLPDMVARRSMRGVALLGMIQKASPWLRRVERFVKPRPSFLTTRTGERLVGAWCMVLAAIVVLPTPLTNGPPALACLIMALGMLEEDGVVILAGAAFGLLAAAFSLSVVGSLGWALFGGLDLIFG
jgi:hypothetical protein